MNNLNPRNTPLWKWALNFEFWQLAGLVMIGKIIWLFILGIHYEDDSLGYMFLHAGLYHPPVYSAFVDGVMTLFGRLHLVVLLQILVFGFTISLALSEWVTHRGLKWLAAFLIAADYATGIFCVSILSECMFLVQTLLALILLVRLGKNINNWKLAALLGLLLGISYVTRYAALLTIVVALVYLGLLHWRSWKPLLLGAGLLIAGFQVGIMPVRAYYLAQFDTMSINAFTGMSRWNNAAYLFPGDAFCGIEESEVYAGKSMKTRFILHLLDQNQESGVFSLESTFTTSHIHNPHYPLQLFMTGNKLSTSEVIELSGALTSISNYLVRNNLLEHTFRFIIPNFFRPFTQSEQVAFPEMDQYFQINYNYTNSRIINWWHYYWWLGFFLLCLTTCLGVWKWKNQDLSWKALLLFCWAYLPAVVLNAVMFQRYVYFMIPLIILALFSTKFPTKKLVHPSIH